jgi:hypothetical protein
MHAAPVRETLRRAIPEDQRYYHSPSMDHHNKDDPKDKGDNLMLTVTGLHEDLDEYIDFSMISQAEGLKFALELFRRRKPHCSGTLPSSPGASSTTTGSARPATTTRGAPTPHSSPPLNPRRTVR